MGKRATLTTRSGRILTGTKYKEMIVLFAGFLWVDFRVDRKYFDKFAKDLCA